MKKHFSLPTIITLVALAIIGVLIAALPEFRQWLIEAYRVFASGELERVKAFLQDYKDYGYLILLAAFLVQMFLFVIPSIMVMALCVLMYGPLAGIALCILGISLASSIAWIIGQSLSGVTLDKIVGHRTREKMSDYLENYGFWTVALCRLSPFLSNDAVSFVAGLVSMSYRRFMLATLAGITPLSLLVGWVGDDYQRLETGLIIGSGIGLFGLGLYIYLDRRKKNDSIAREDAGNRA